MTPEEQEAAAKAHPTLQRWADNQRVQNMAKNRYLNEKSAGLQDAAARHSSQLEALAQRAARALKLDKTVYTEQDLNEDVWRHPHRPRNPVYGNEDARDEGELDDPKQAVQDEMKAVQEQLDSVRRAKEAARNPESKNWTKEQWLQWTEATRK